MPALTMEFDRVVRARRMVRRFTDTAIEPGTVDQLLELSRRVPSAGFSQGVHAVVLSGPDQTSCFWDAYLPAGERVGHVYEHVVPASVVVTMWVEVAAYLRRYAAADKVTSTGRPELGSDPSAWPVPWWYVDAGMAAVTVLHAAVDAGLGGLFFGLHHREAEVRTALGVPDDVLTAGVVVVGHPHPDDQPTGSPTVRPRRPLDEVVHHARW